VADRAGADVGRLIDLGALAPTDDRFGERDGMSSRRAVACDPWSMEGDLVGSDEKNITGETTFRWLPGGSFLEQRVHIDDMGLAIDSLEVIRYDPETDSFPSTVYSTFSPDPLPYRWQVRGDDVTISVSYGELDATFTGSWREDGTFSGGWRPNPGADETLNAPYDIGEHRLRDD
jgi:hypothetical protein